MHMTSSASASDVLVSDALTGLDFHSCLSTMTSVGCEITIAIAVYVITGYVIINHRIRRYVSPVT